MLEYYKITIFFFAKLQLQNLKKYKFTNSHAKLQKTVPVSSFFFVQTDNAEKNLSVRDRSTKSQNYKITNTFAELHNPFQSQ